MGGINFNFHQTENPCIIKVVGVGGGGGNAINHMYREGIHEVTYVVCNTDITQNFATNLLVLGFLVGHNALGSGDDGNT